MTEPPRGFVAFLEAVRWFAHARPMPRLSAAIDLANAVRAGQIAAIYLDHAGQWAQVKGRALNAQIGLETGEIHLPVQPGASEPIAVVTLGKGWDDIGDDLDWEGDPPSYDPEPRPKVELEPEPLEELRHCFSELKRRAIWHGYYERNAAVYAALNGWHDREEKRKAACAAYDLAWRQHDERRRRLAPPVQQTEIITRGSAAPRGEPLFLRFADVHRCAAPPSARAIPAAEPAEIQSASPQKPGRRAGYDEAAVANLAREMVRRDGLPASQQKIVLAIRAALWPGPTGAPAERTLRRQIAKLWQELSEIAQHIKPHTGK
jgi:hypothetical protein